MRHIRIRIRIARKGIDASQHLRRHHWAVARNLVWLNHFRRLRVRHERQADIRQAFVTLGCDLLY